MENLKNHIVFFEIYGKKMKTTVIAKNEEEVKKHLESKITIHKIYTQNDTIDNLVNELKDFWAGDVMLLGSICQNCFFDSMIKINGKHICELCGHEQIQ
jgi:hypothetical protein